MNTTDILLIINLVISFLTPVLMGIIEIFKRVKKSSCMGSESVLSPQSSVNVEKPDSKEENLQAVQEIINRLSINNDRNKNISL